MKAFSYLPKTREELRQVEIPEAIIDALLDESTLGGSYYYRLALPQSINCFYEIRSHQELDFAQAKDPNILEKAQTVPIFMTRSQLKLLFFIDRKRSKITENYLARFSARHLPLLISYLDTRNVPKLNEILISRIKTLIEYITEVKEDVEPEKIISDQLSLSLGKLYSLRTLCKLTPGPFKHVFYNRLKSLGRRQVFESCAERNDHLLLEINQALDSLRESIEALCKEKDADLLDFIKNMGIFFEQTKDRIKELHSSCDEKREFSALISLYQKLKKDAPDDMRWEVFQPIIVREILKRNFTE